MTDSVAPDSLITLHYRLTNQDGTEIISTFGSTPATLQLGADELAPTLEQCILQMTIGEERRFELDAAAAYGAHNPQLVQRIGRNALPADAVVEIDVGDQEIIRRMSGRRVHPGSGRTYHVVFNPPKVNNVDDATGEPLVQRDDDKEETVKQRLKVYHEQTEPLVHFYSKWKSANDPQAPRCIKVPGTGKVESVRDAIYGALGK